MTEIMNASIEQTMTDGQIKDAVNKFRAALLKKRGEFPSSAAQLALGTDNLGMHLLAPFRKLVEANNDLIVRIVSVNRARSGREAIKATGRNLYVSNDVVDAMPNGKGDQIELVFFKPKAGEYTRPGFMSDDDLEKALALRGLGAADPFSVAAHNEADPAFADERPNATHWKDASGRWCYAAFRRWGGERCVFVGRDDGDWVVDWWFVGVRKST